MNILMPTTTGHVAPTPGAAKVPGCFAVEQQLQAMGLTAWTPRKIVFERSGKDRYPKPVTKPYLPGYVFADVPPQAFHAALQARGAFPTIMTLSRGDLAAVRAFQRRVDAENAEAERIIASRDRAAMCQFTPGQALEVLAGPFADRLVTFSRLVLASVPHIEFETELFGQVVKGKVDVLDVRAANP